MEEASFMDADSFFDIVVPLLTLKNVALLCISTKGEDERNHFDVLLESGEIRKYEVSLICESCLAAGEKSDCKHRRDRIPPWSSKEARAKVQRIYGQAHHDKYLREVVGIVKHNAQCFPTQQVNATFSRPPVPLASKSVDHVFVAIDPAGGSSDSATRTSDYAVVSIIEQGCLIVGVDAIDVSGIGMAYQDQIVEHFRRVLTIPKCEGAMFVVAIENNWGLENVTLGARLQHEFMGRIIIMDEHENKPGVWTGPRLKNNAMTLLQNLFIRDQVNFAQGWVTTHKNPDQLVSEFHAQALRFELVTQDPKTPFNKVRKVLSGKMGGNRDDIIMALQLVVWWRDVFWKDRNKYGRWHTVDDT